MGATSRGGVSPGVSWQARLLQCLRSVDARVGGLSSLIERLELGSPS
jgi:hypothetical protein